MKRYRLGTKPFTSTLIVFVTTLLALNAGLLRFEYFQLLDIYVTCFIGAFSMLLATGFYRYLRLNEPSVFRLALSRYPNSTFEIDVDDTLLLRYKEYALTIGHNHSGNAREFPPLLQRILFIIIFFNIGLMALNNRSLSLIASAPERLRLAKVQYCPDQEAEDFDAPEKLGCELLVKAYKLGYAKDLGPCEPEKGEFADEVCMLRRRDEPYLHYAWRLLTQFSDTVQHSSNPETLELRAKRFEEKTNHLELLGLHQKHAINADPRASHHIWTNLPYPEHWILSKFHDVFSPGRCIEHYQEMGNSISVDESNRRAPSLYLDHAAGQLLFSTRVKTTAGYCKEYTIHWESPDTSCRQLAENPELFLESQGVVDEVNQVLSRQHLGAALADLRDRLKELYPVKPANRFLQKAMEFLPELEIEIGSNSERVVTRKSTISTPHQKKSEPEEETERRRREATEVVSFQCYMTHDEPDKTSDEASFTLHGTEFKAREIYFPKQHVPSEMQVASYHNISELLAKDFRYNKLVSRAGIDLSLDQESIIKELQKSDFLMTRLELLRGADIFLGHEWVYDQEGLDEIYPYYVHLKRFVQVFRDQYVQQRGRL